jgi:uncharacterized protein YndB with AHSA1/START domain
MVIEKAISIAKDLNTVFNFLKDTKNQDRFNVWIMADPNMNKTYSGTDGTKGFVYSWDSKDKNVGAGSQEITDIVPNSRIDYVIRFLRPFKNIADVTFQLQKITDASTSVTWTFDSPAKFPMSLFSPILKKMLGKQLQQSLDNLKAILEK